MTADTHAWDEDAMSAKVTDVLLRAGADFCENAENGSFQDWQRARSIAVVRMFAPEVTAREQAPAVAMREAVASWIEGRRDAAAPNTGAASRYDWLALGIRSLPIETGALDAMLAHAREEGFALASQVAMAALEPSDGAMYSADRWAAMAAYRARERVKAKLDEARGDV